LIDFNLGLIEGKAGVLVFASAGPDGSLGQAWRLLETEELAGIERIRRQAEPAVTSRPVRDETRDLCSVSTQCLSLRDTEGKLLEFGRELFNILVQDEVREVYERARSATLNGGGNALLILLKLRVLSSLQQVPWELLHDGHRFLAKDPRTAIVRYFEQPVPVASLEVEPPLRVLVTLAGPKDMTPLALEEEAEAIGMAYMEAGPLVEVVVKRNISLEKLEKVWRRAGNEGKPFHIWHHCGHGGRRTHGGQDELVLYLETEGKSQPAAIDQLQEIVGFCPELRIAVFNVCHGGASAGIVPALARLNVPVVIGFQQAVRDTSAVQFAIVLHEGLLHIPVEFAVSQARSSLKLQRSSFDWVHALAFSRRRDRGTLLPKPARKESSAALKKEREPRKSRGKVIIEVGTLGGTDNEVIGVSSTGGNHSGFGDAPNIHMKAREITGSGARLVGFQMIDGFSDADLVARETRIEKLLQKLEEQSQRGR
jgi:hypothetical protein